MDLTLLRLMKWRLDLTRLDQNYESNIEEYYKPIDDEEVAKKSKYSPPLFYKEHALRCQKFVFFLHSFPQNERKIH